ncbi:uncharacterized protein MEPE_02260 [Melanopsichium pennsylvanicum]|uniref:Uncharacterized protein n=2 Tax=Melanopsichium pennsylvanicum TaxID=63383 RepID=A0AAJ4XK24_9BASI|nr:putative protein [Melanopsichium pennsylvanicum 4]SNX83553.1 uncharacterized protein MEPE_02260 [Melanopsichium pennsylvanicum]
MFATTDDLKLSPKINEQPQSFQDHSKSRLSSAGHQIHSSDTPICDSADEISVMEDQQTAIPIRADLDRRHSNRHSDLDIGSVHCCKPRLSPLCERRERDDYDFLTDCMVSSDDACSGNSVRDQWARGRERRTKPLLRSRHTVPPHRPQRYEYDVDSMELFTPQLGDQTDRADSLNGRRPLEDLDATPKRRNHYRTKGSNHKQSHSRRQAPLSIPSGLEHEAMVFDNFEDISSISSASEQEQETVDPFDAHLHFVRPAMPICANPGAFVALEPIMFSGGCANDVSQEGAVGERVSAQQKRNRLGHHRTVSELFSCSTTCPESAEVRAMRRRATVGSEAAYRLPSFSR